MCAMNRIRKFLALAPADRRLLLRATVLVAAVRVARTVLPWPALRRVVAWAARPGGVAQGVVDMPTDRLGWAVEVAGRYIPDATCLTRALALQIWLGRHGQPAALRLGVARGAGERLEAHAWLEREGRVIIGAAELARYTPLPPLEGRDG
jgi:hypothetical protein